MKRRHVNRLILLPLFPALLATAAVGHAEHWVRSWAAAPQEVLPASANSPMPDLKDRTLRQVVRLSAGGTALRIRLTNELSEAPLTLGRVTIAATEPDGRIVANSVRVVDFGGATAIPAHAPLVSAPIAFKVAPLQRVTISIHLPEGAAAPTIHAYSAATAWIAAGDQTGAATLADAATYGRRAIIAAVDVDAPRTARTVVTLGDSITDGVRATDDADTRYPDLLAERLQKAGMRDVAVANLGLSGNRILTDGTGPNALSRFDRDVLAVPHVSHVLVLEGVNDIGSAARAKQPLPTPQSMIAAYRQMIARAHAEGVKVILCTILPYKGAGYWTPEGEAVRKAVNAWMLSTREADGVVDLARAIADPADPDRMAKPYDVGDALHPNDAGFKVMAEAVDLKLLR